MTMFGTQETRAEKIRRAGLGALYGFLGGAAFVLVAGFIDPWLNPDLPLGVNWSMFWVRLPLIGAGLALVGALTCWWRETWQGLLAGAASASALALIFALYSSDAIGIGAKLVVMFFTLTPIAVMVLPVAWMIRRLVERHHAARGAHWGAARIAGLLFTAVLLGGGLGYFMKSPEQGIQAIRFVDGHLSDPFAEKNPVSREVDIQAHASSSYAMYATRSAASTEGFDVYVRYADGFTLQCMVVVYPGQTPYISACKAEPESTP
jgi:hypothetical protein